MSMISTALQASPTAGILERGWRFLVAEFIQDVPESLALCEFDCRQTNCSGERWLSCERRLEAARRAMGEPGSPA